MKTILVGVAALALTSIAMGDYLNPPPWDGVLSGYETYQGWEFETDLTPTTVENPYGDPTMYDDYGTTQWVDTYEGRQGLVLLPYDEYLNIEVPNANNDNPRKEIWFQITYFSTGGWASLSAEFEGWGGESSGFGGESILAQDLGGGWYYEAFHWFIEPNPAGETFYLSTWDDIYIDQIHIDTICIPAPGALAMFGVVCLGRRRRR